MKILSFSKKIKIWIILTFILFGVIGGGYKLSSPHPIEKIIKKESNQNVFNFLILAGAENHYSGITLVSYHWAKNYMNIFNIPYYVNFKNNQQQYKEAQFLSKANLLDIVERILGTPVHFYLQIHRHDWKNMLDNLGGVEIFNDISDHYDYGRLYINSKNIDSYLNSIDNQVIKIESIYNLVINLLRSTLGYYKTFSDGKTLGNFLLPYINSNLPDRIFKKIIEKLLNNHLNLHLNYSRMNLDPIEINGKKALVPIQNGHYDGQKLKQIIKTFDLIDQHLLRFPISLQVKNTTSISRLAAKTAGVLRRKKCNVKEYLNSAIDLKESLIIDRCGSSVKLEYLKKITKIDSVYYAIDYRENFDFTLYLGEDYYAIPKINQ